MLEVKSSKTPDMDANMKMDNTIPANEHVHGADDDK